VRVVRVPTGPYGARYAHWLAELSEALDEARRLLKQIGAPEGRMEAVELYARIEALRLEIKRLRLGREFSPAREIDPKRTGTSPWNGNRSF
jgi:hypothetical protein